MKTDELADKLVSDPSQNPNVIMLVGFVGKSSKAGTVRLYTTLDMNDYLEFSESDVVHSRQLPADTSPLGGTMLWLKNDTKMVRTHTTPPQTQAEFLQGAITSSYLAGATIPTINYPTLSTYWCNNISRFAYGCTGRFALCIDPTEVELVRLQASAVCTKVAACRTGLAGPGARWCI